MKLQQAQAKMRFNSNKSSNFGAGNSRNQMVSKQTTNLSVTHGTQRTGTNQHSSYNRRVSGTSSAGINKRVKFISLNDKKNIHKFYNEESIENPLTYDNDKDDIVLINQSKTLSGSKSSNSRNVSNAGLTMSRGSLNGSHKRSKQNLATFLSQ